MKSSFVRLRSALALLVSLAIALPLSLDGGPVPANKPAAYPAWWFERDVIPRLDPNNAAPDFSVPGTYATPDDYAAVNQGQLKHIATQAYLEMQTRGLVDANSPITTMVTAWGTSGANTDDYQAINLGQLKNVAEPFYARLVDEFGYTGQPFVSDQIIISGARPWSGTADDYALANIGQVKSLFSFIIPNVVVDPNDTDGNGLLDSWEMEHFGTMGISPLSDSDGDGVTNLAEFVAGSDPLSQNNNSVRLTLFAPVLR